MFELPIIRFDDQKWLEELQKGQFYMRPSMYYQLMEEDGYVRNDPFDGSIPFPDNDKILKSISGKETVRERLLLFDMFIKCFYHCTEEDIIYDERPVPVTVTGAIPFVRHLEETSLQIRSDSIKSKFTLSSLCFHRQAVCFDHKMSTLYRYKEERMND